jgi:hypothetical protein
LRLWLIFPAECLIGANVTAIGSEAIEAVADRGYYSGEEIVACEQAGTAVYLPKPVT